MKHKIQAVTPRLSDEDPDPLEQDEVENASTQSIEGWAPWNPEDLFDVKMLIHDWMPPKHQEIFLAFLDGLTHKDIGVTEKYWRYHFDKGIEFIKQELDL
jgi:hypothetical protein